MLVYEERQPPPGWVWIVVVVCLGPGVVAGAILWMAGGSRGELGLALVIDAVVVGALALFLSGVRIRVYDSELEGRLGYWPWRFRAALLDILWCRVTGYSALRDFGGWGFRRSLRHPGVRAINGRGDRGLLVALADGRRMLLGSDEPERVAEALGAMGVTVLPPAENLDAALEG